MDAFLGLLVGFAIGLALGVFVLNPLSPKWTEEKPVVLQVTKSGVLCRKQEEYPHLDCKALQAALGERRQRDKLETTGP